MQRLESKLERALFASRWLIAPFVGGLVIAILALLIKFAKELMVLVPAALGGSSPGRSAFISPSSSPGCSSR